MQSKKIGVRVSKCYPWNTTLLHGPWPDFFSLQFSSNICIFFETCEVLNVLLRDWPLLPDDWNGAWPK